MDVYENIRRKFKQKDENRQQKLQKKALLVDRFLLDRLRDKVKSLFVTDHGLFVFIRNRILNRFRILIFHKKSSPSLSRCVLLLY